MTDGEPAAPMLDRDLQLRLLQEMRSVHPGPFNDLPDDLPSLEEVQANLLYLEQHGLCDSGMAPNVNGTFTQLRGATITARGLDFLEEDGGLSAALGVVTIRLHADTLRELIREKAEAEAASPEERSAIRRHLASLPETALTAGVADLVKQGLDHLPSVLAWLRTLGAA